MEFFKRTFIKLSDTDALKASSGPLENGFFEFVYRVEYMAGSSRFDQTIGYKIYSNILKTMMFLLLCAETWFLYSEYADFDAISDSINVLVIQIISIYRAKKMLDHKEIFIRLAKSTQSPQFDITTESRRGQLDYWLKKNRKFSWIVFSLGNCTLIAWYIYPLLDDIEYNLILAVYLPIEYKTPLRYAVAYILLIISLQFASHIVIVNDLTVQSHLMHIICQFSVLSDCFERLVEDCSAGIEGISGSNILLNEEFKSRYLQRLRHLICQHKFILMNVKELRAILSAPMLGQYVASGILITFIGFQTAVSLSVNITKFVMSLFYLAYNIVQLYLICNWCDMVATKCDDVGNSVYYSNWETGMTSIPGVRSQLLFIMARASKPVVFTAGGMYELSLKSFSTLMNTSYSALTVMLRFRK